MQVLSPAIVIMEPVIGSICFGSDIWKGMDMKKIFKRIGVLTLVIMLLLQSFGLSARAAEEVSEESYSDETVIEDIDLENAESILSWIMENIPDTILEAARVDGASEHRIFWLIVVPNVKPAWMTLVIFTVQSMWSTTGGTYIYSEELKTLQTALNQIVSSGISRTGVSAAISLIMMAVPIATFIISQKNVVQTMMSSGIKE